MGLSNSDVMPSIPSVSGDYYDYTIDQSLFADRSSSSYAYRTPSTAGNQKTNTFSFWYKPQTLYQNRYFFTSNASQSSTDWFIYGLTDENKLYVDNWDYQARTNYQLNDSSAWYHIVFITDTTQSTASDRWRFYVNGERQEAQSGATYPTQNQNTGANNTNQHELFTRMWQSYNYLGGTVAEVHFIDGQALDPSYFGETGTYEDWKPIEYTGSYGTNGFYMNFSNSSNICADSSGNGNHYTTTGISAHDIKLDSPTNNFATLNALHRQVGSNGASLSQGNLIYSGGSDWGYAVSTIAVPKDKKIYVETMSAQGLGYQGVIRADFNAFSGGTRLDGYAKGLVSEYYDSDTLIAYYERDASGSGSQSTVSGSGFQSTNQVKGMLIDQANSTVKFYRGGTLVRTEVQSDAFNTTDDYVVVVAGGYSSNYPRINFGQDSSFAGTVTAQGNTDANGYGDFYYDPTSFDSEALALCTANLDEPTIIPTEHFNAVLYAGNHSAEIDVSVGFQPDFIWIKNRSNANSANITDAIRGVDKWLIPDYTGAERNDSSNNSGIPRINSIGSDGFQVNDNDNHEVNHTGYNYVSWNWKAGNGTSSNTNGSITTTVSANQDAGFSIINYTGGGSAGDTLGHGLSQAPEMMIWKTRDSVENWGVFNSHVQTLNTADRLYLNSSSAEVTSGDNRINALSSTTITLGSNNGEINSSSDNYIMYCFHSVPGFSKVGSYDGVFSVGATGDNLIYTGFRPAFVMIKCYTATEHWIMFDNKRVGYNDDNRILYNNTLTTEYTDTKYLEIYSNGFSASYGTGEVAVSGKSFIYIAFAESPFKYANAR